MPRKPTKKKTVAKKGPSYQQMAIEAVTELADRTGSSQPAIEKYILATYRRLDYKRHFLRNAIKRAIEKGTLAVHHNHKNSYKLPPKAKPAAKKKKTVKKTVKKTTKKVC